jgi:hypothetical protein
MKLSVSLLCQKDYLLQYRVDWLKQVEEGKIEGCLQVCAVGGGGSRNIAKW